MSTEENGRETVEASGPEEKESKREAGRPGRGPKRRLRRSWGGWIGVLTRRGLWLGLVAAVVAIPMVWRFMPQQYEATVAVQIKKIINSFIFGDETTDRPMPNYESFRNTQAEYLVSPLVMDEVANQLGKEKISLNILRAKPDGFFRLLKEIWIRKDLSLWFRESSGLENRLMKLVDNGTIVAVPQPDSEMITVTMRHTDPDEALRIVRAICMAYMLKIVRPMEVHETGKLRDLHVEKDQFCRSILNLRERIQEIAMKYGTGDLERWQEVTMERKVAIAKRVGELEREKVAIEGELAKLEGQNGTESSIPAVEDELLKQDYINKDPQVQSLIRNIIEVQEQLIKAHEILSEQNPELCRLQNRLVLLQSALNKRKTELEQSYYELRMGGAGAVSSVAMAQAIREEPMRSIKEQLENRDDELDKLKTELERLEKDYKNAGRDLLEMWQRQDDLTILKPIYDRIMTRIYQLEIELSRRPGRIEVPYEPTSNALPDLRGWITFWLGGGIGVAVVGIFLLRKVG